MRRRITATLLALAIISCSMLFAAPAAHAQCTTITAYNFTGCDLGLCLYDAAGTRVCVTLNAIGGPFPISFVAPYTPVGVFSAAKNQYPFTGNPACTICIMLPGAQVPTGCCAQVCYDPLTCTITVSSCGPHCAP